MQHKLSIDLPEDAPFQVDILKSNSNLHVQKTGDNEINIVGIENNEQHEFLVEITLRHIDQCDHLDENIDLIYMLFDEHKLELNKNSENGQFPIDQTLSITFKSALSDLISYFRHIFSLPIVLATQNTNIKGLTILTFGDSLSTLPTSVESFHEIFGANNLQYQFDTYASIMFTMNENDDKESNIHYGFSLKLLPLSKDRPASTTSLLLPHTTLQSTSFNKISSAPATASAQAEPAIDKETGDLVDKNEESGDDATTAAGIPKTFAYTLSLLDCTFNKRPFPGIWQLR